MQGTIIFAILALAASCITLTGRLLPRSITGETIETKPAASRLGGLRVDQTPHSRDLSLDTADLSQFALLAKPHPNTTSCPTIDPFFQTLESSAHRQREAAARLHSRAIALSPFGRITETIPADAQRQRDAQAHKISLVFDGQNLHAPGCFVKVSIISYPINTDHPIPGWRNLQGTIMPAGYTTLDNAEEINAHHVEAMVTKVFLQALALNQMVLGAIDAIEPSISFLNHYTASAGQWNIHIVPFNDVPGYCYAISRTGAETVTGPMMPPKKAIATAGLLIVHLTLDMLIFEMSHPKGDLDQMDILAIMILLYVLKDLFETTQGALWHGGGPSPPPDDLDVKLAINEFATGNLGSPIDDDMFKTAAQISSMLQSDPLCRRSVSPD